MDLFDKTEVATPERVRRRELTTPERDPGFIRTGDGICISPHWGTGEVNVQGYIPVRSVESRHAGN